MKDRTKDPRGKTQLLEEIERLQFRLQEAEETLEAIRHAEVDALVVAGPQGEQVFSITGAERIYRVIVETMNEAALTVDPDGTILFCNQRFCDLMKTPMQGAMGRKVTAFAAWPQQLSLRRVLAEAQVGPTQQHLLLQATDGTSVPVQLAASPLPMSDHASICLVASDLTELEESAHSIRVLREHQQALEESEARFRTMFEASHDAIVITDDAGVCIQANPAAAAIFGLPPEQLVGRNVSEFMDVTLDFPTFWQGFLAKGSFHGELGLIDAKRQQREVDFYGVTNILPGRHMAVVRNVTERKQAEEKLRASEERYRRLFDEDLTGDFLATPDGKVLECNPAFAEIYGFADRQHALGCDISQFNPTDWAELMTRLRAECKVQGHQGVHRRPDGREIHVVANVVGRFNEAAELVEVQGYLYDDTERKHAEEALHSAALFPEQNPVPVLRVARTGTLLYANGASAFLLRSWGCRPGQTVPAEIQRYVAEALDSQETTEADVVCGPTIYSFAIAPVVSEGYANLYARDVTKRKQAEEALRKSEEKFAKAFRSSPIAVALTRQSDGQIVEVNEAVLKLLRFSRDEVIGHTTLDLGIWADVKDRARFIQQISATGSVRDLEYRLRTKDGAIVTIRLSAEALEFSGEPCMLSTLVDVTQQKETEEALRESEERLKRAQGIAHLGSWELDLVNNRLSWSDEVYRIFGLAPQEFKATYEAFLETVHPDDRAAVDAAYSGSLREGQNDYEIEHRIVRRSTGEIRTVHEKCEHVRDASGRIVRSVGMVHDITERKRAEEALRASEDRLRLAQQIAQVGTFDWDIQTGVNVWTPELEAMYGLPPGGFTQTQQAWAQLVHPDDRAEAQRLVEQAFETGEPTQGEWRVRWPDGSIHWLVARWQAFRDAAGQPLRMTGVNIDITERKRAEEALQESKERFHHLFEEDLTGNFISTPEGQILLCNPAFARIFGFSTAVEAVGTNILDLYLDPQEREPLLARLRQQEKIERLEVWRQRRDGTRIYIVENLVGHFDERGELYEIKGYIFDDTERRRAEEALRELNTTLESKVAERTGELQQRARQLQKLALELSETEDRERRQLAEILHDDLQQQLAAAKFHLSLLNSRAKRDPSQRAVIAQVDQMLMEAIQKSRNLSHELSPAVLYHADFTGALNWLAGQLHAKHGLEVAVDAFGEVNVQSEALKIFLYKAAQELLFNVVKHARINQARIRVRRLGRCICLSVSDRGRGFDPQELHQTPGFGLLSIRERIELLGGRMKIHSVKGQGTTFHIAVPDGPLAEDKGRTTIREDGRQKTAGGLASSIHRPPSSGRVLRVLLADDHAIVREGLRSLLSDERDIEVVGEAANGREAVDQAYRLQPDVVIMDVAMPLINGDDATRQIKMHLPQTRVVALSMYEEPDLLDKMYRAGAEDYILKTAPAEKLLAVIRGKARAEVTA